MTAIAAPRFKVRYSEVGFEMACLRCDHYWPMDLTFWQPSSFGLRVCAACGKTLRRLAKSKLESDARKRRYYVANRPRINARRRQRWQDSTDEEKAALRAYHAKWREAHREELRIYNRQWRADRKRLAEAA